MIQRADVMAETRDKMQKAVEVAKDDFSTVRTGRANPQLFRRCSSTTTARRPRSASWPR